MSTILQSPQSNSGSPPEFRSCDLNKWRPPLIPIAFAIYDHGGRLRFSGGITAARGHWGDNTGVFEVESLLRGEQSRQAITPVFRCSLFGARGKNSARGNPPCKR